MVFSKLKDFILKKASKSGLARRIFCLLGDELFWDIGARTKKAAMQITINTQKPEAFDKQGMDLAEELKTRINRDSVILDFGCGIGRPERFLAPYCRQIHGVDLSRRMIRLARKRHQDIENVHFYKNNGRDLSMFQDGTFDFVTSEAVFQHMNKERAVLLLFEMHRVLKKDGVIFLQFCNLLSPVNLDGFISLSKQEVLTPVRMRYWLPEEVRSVIQAVGFQAISVEVKSDAHDENRELRVDEYHRDYSIWLHASK